jgi:hypothetical protein
VAEDLEEQVGAVFVDRQEAELVDDQQIGLEVASDLALEPARRLCGGQRINDVDGGGEEYGVAADACGMAEGDGDVCFAKADRDPFILPI